MPILEKGGKCGDESNMVPIDDEHLCSTIISWDIDLSINNTPEIAYFVLSSLHIGGAKYRVY